MRQRLPAFLHLLLYTTAQPATMLASTRAHLALALLALLASSAVALGE